jgi:hypothetical protein
MAEVLTGKRLHTVQQEIEKRVERTVNSEDMNFLAYLNYIVDCNKKYSLGSAVSMLHAD